MRHKERQWEPPSTQSPGAFDRARGALIEQRAPQDGYRAASVQAVSHRAGHELCVHACGGEGPAPPHRVEGVGAQVHELGVGLDLRGGRGGGAGSALMMPDQGARPVQAPPVSARPPAVGHHAPPPPYACPQAHLVQLSAQLLGDDAAHIGHHGGLVLRDRAAGGVAGAVSACRHAACDPLRKQPWVPDWAVMDTGRPLDAGNNSWVLRAVARGGVTGAGTICSPAKRHPGPCPHHGRAGDDAAGTGCHNGAHSRLGGLEWGPHGWPVWSEWHPREAAERTLPTPNEASATLCMHNSGYAALSPPGASQRGSSTWPAW